MNVLSINQFYIVNSRIPRLPCLWYRSLGMRLVAWHACTSDVTWVDFVSSMEGRNGGWKYSISIRAASHDSGT